MQQPPPPPGGAQYGVPQSDMSPFASPSSAAARQMPALHAEAASPINSRPPPQSFEELLPGGSAGNFPDDIGGDETERGGASGNRWPRQETLALLKIRSDMDAVFRDATLKGPLWEEVSRKLGELGYRRSAKKCKEKFENVHKYYKRTKENRAGRNDGKTYRFFSQLEALHGASTPTSTPMHSNVPNLPLTSMQMPTQIPGTTPATIGFSAPMVGPSRVVAPVTPIETSSAQPVLRSIQDIGASLPTAQGISGSTTPTTAAPTTAGISFSSNTESSESEDSDDEDTEEIGGTQEQGKRKRQGGSGGGGSSKKMMSFFEGLMKQVMERQEAMQQRFLETIEKREQDRMIREEAWRRQEMARLSREQEILAQERAMAASRDAAVVSFIQKITGQNIPLPTISAPVITVVPPQAVPVTVIPQPQPQPPQHSQSQPSPKTPRQQNPQPLPPQASTPPAVPQPPPQLQPQPSHQPQQQLQQQHSTDIVVRQQQPSVTSTEIVHSAPEGQEPGMGGGFEPGSSSGATSSRWPKAEVHALIKIRSGMDSRYQEVGPKGPLWEEISAGMRRLGYNRNAKRCKEKWENINKYFKKVKESNKKRPEDSKTCPYFHQLDALYRNKYGGGAGGATGSQFEANTNPNSQDSLTFSGPAPLQGLPQPQPISQQPPAGESDSRNSNAAGKDNTNTNNDSNRNGNGTDGGNGGTGGTQIQTSNGGATATTYYSDPSSMGMKKPEDLMKELMEHRQQHNGYDKFDEGEGDSMDDEDDEEYDDDDDGEDDDDGKMQYKIQFQRPNMNVNVSGTGGGNPPASTAPPSTTPGSNSFLAMVK